MSLSISDKIHCVRRHTVYPCWRCKWLYLPTSISPPSLPVMCNWMEIPVELRSANQTVWYSVFPHWKSFLYHGSHHYWSLVHYKMSSITVARFCYSVHLTVSNGLLTHSVWQIIFRSKIFQHWFCSFYTKFYFLFLLLLILFCFSPLVSRQTERRHVVIWANHDSVNIQCRRIVLNVYCIMHY